MLERIVGSDAILIHEHPCNQVAQLDGSSEFHRSPFVHPSQRISLRERQQLLDLPFEAMASFRREWPREPASNMWLGGHPIRPDSSMSSCASQFGVMRCLLR